MTIEKKKVIGAVGAAALTFAITSFALATQGAPEQAEGPQVKSGARAHFPKGNELSPQSLTPAELYDYMISDICTSGSGVNPLDSGTCSSHSNMIYTANYVAKDYSSSPSQVQSFRLGYYDGSQWLARLQTLVDGGSDGFFQRHATVDGGETKEGNGDWISTIATEDSGSPHQHLWLLDGNCSTYESDAYRLLKTDISTTQQVSNRQKVWIVDADAGLNSCSGTYGNVAWHETYYYHASGVTLPKANKTTSVVISRVFALAGLNSDGTGSPSEVGLEEHWYTKELGLTRFETWDSYATSTWSGWSECYSADPGPRTFYGQTAYLTSCREWTNVSAHDSFDVRAWNFEPETPVFANRVKNPDFWTTEASTSTWYNQDCEVFTATTAGAGDAANTYLTVKETSSSTCQFWASPRPELTAKETEAYQDGGSARIHFGLRAKADSSATVDVKINFWDGSTYLGTETKTFTAGTSWGTYAWDTTQFAGGSYHVTSVDVHVFVKTAQTNVYMDDFFLNVSDIDI